MHQCPECLLKLGFPGPTSVAAAGAGRFGEYELLRQIGRGAMGVVYEALHVKLNRRVALKMILDSQITSPVVRHRFNVEAQAAAKLDHPNIVPIYEVGEWNGQPYLAMKLVQGRSLREQMARGEIGLGRTHKSHERGGSERAKRVARFMATVARAVQHAHEHAVLHRDLKPANILIDSEGQPHLTDFGLAKLLDTASIQAGEASATGSGAVLGTPSYMSPEQAASLQPSAASDVYSLGAILYELLTGEPPFKEASAWETMRLVVEEEPRRPRAVHHGVPKDLETIPPHGGNEHLRKPNRTGYGLRAGAEVS